MKSGGSLIAGQLRAAMSLRGRREAVKLDPADRHGPHFRGSRQEPINRLRIDKSFQRLTNFCFRKTEDGGILFFASCLARETACPNCRAPSEDLWRSAEVGSSWRIGPTAAEGLTAIEARPAAPATPAASVYRGRAAPSSGLPRVPAALVVRE